MRILFIIMACLLLTGCQSDPPREYYHDTVPETTQAPPETTAAPTLPPDPVEVLLEEMTLNERVGQLFLARCDDTRALTDISVYHLGGFVLFGNDFEEQDPFSIRRKLGNYQAAAKIPLLLAVDEEGGTVTRVSRYPAFRDRKFPSPGRPSTRAGWTRPWPSKKKISTSGQSGAECEPGSRLRHCPGSLRLYV